MKTFQIIYIIYWSVIQIDNTADSKTDELLKITWHVLGPFPCGMNEVDGIPPILPHQDFRIPFSLPPTNKIFKERYHSEFKANGVINWTKISQLSNLGQFVVQFSSVQWRELIQSLSSTELLQWQRG